MAYSILSLDGGGSWALIQVRILQERYPNPALTGHEILKKYDMVIANSGGSLVLAALCANKTLQEIRALFEDEEVLKTIFHKKNIHIPDLDRFSSEQKKIGLINALGVTGDLFVNELPAYIGKPSLQLIITGFDYNTTRSVFFRSNEGSMMEDDNIMAAVAGKAPLNPNPDFHSITLLDAVHASTNAPVLFFDKPAVINYHINGYQTKDRLMWDGAVGGNNNPVAVGLLEALANGEQKDDIRIISLGTCTNIYPVMYGEANDAIPEYDWLVKESHMLNDLEEAKKLAMAVVDDPPDAATFIANQILGLPNVQTQNRLIRINPMLKAILSEDGTRWNCPGNNWPPEDLNTIYRMDMAITESDKIALINKLCDDFFEGYFTNQGIRTGGKRLEAILGHKTFKDAMHDWRSWDHLFS